MFPDERLSCIVGRDIRFLLAVDEGGAAGSCVLASSTEPLRTEILFMHALRTERVVLKTLLSDVLSFLNSRRASDIEIKYVEGMHLPSLRGVLNDHGFAEAVKDRMILRASNVKKASLLSDSRFRVRSTDSLLNWRAMYLAAALGQPLDDTRKRVYSETPVGTIQEDDLTRLIAYDGKSSVGTIGYSICRTVGYLDNLSMLSGGSDRFSLAKALVMDVIRRLTKKRCDYVVIDVDERALPVDVLGEIGFESVGQLSYFSKTITSKTQTGSQDKSDDHP
jgi:hypothetical protein